MSHQLGPNIYFSSSHMESQILSTTSSLVTPTSSATFSTRCFFDFSIQSSLPLVFLSSLHFHFVPVHSLLLKLFVGIEVIVIVFFRIKGFIIHVFFFFLLLLFLVPFTTKSLNGLLQRSAPGQHLLGLRLRETHLDQGHKPLPLPGVLLDMDHGNQGRRAPASGARGRIPRAAGCVLSPRAFPRAVALPLPVPGWGGSLWRCA
mmetsp:Transcript_4119/g.11479  ORF Transcript_4119/g.11479 Transcript_4119/m.11479 type:complete len:203 (-) Transcript_4119:8-616(-)